MNFLLSLNQSYPHLSTELPELQLPFNFLHNTSDNLLTTTTTTTSITATTNATLYYDLVADEEDVAFDDLFNDIVGVWLTGFVCLLGLAGNLLSFFVLRSPVFLQSPMFYVLRILCAVDSVFLICVLTMQTVVNIPPVRSVATARAVIQFSVWPVLMTAQMMTVWLTILVSAERFIAICYPLRAAVWCSVSRIRRVVIAITLGSAIFNVPRYFEFDVDMTKTLTGTDPIYRYLYTCALYSVLLFILPLSLLFVLNFLLVLRLRRGRRQWKHLQQRQRHEQNITTTPLVIVLVFFVCATPALGVNVTDSIWPKLFADHRYATYVVMANFLVVVNCASNFIVYCLLGNKFRSKARRLLTCHVGGVRGEGGGATVSRWSRTGTTASEVVAPNRIIESKRDVVKESFRVSPRGSDTESERAREKEIRSGGDTPEDFRKEGVLRVMGDEGEMMIISSVDGFKSSADATKSNVVKATGKSERDTHSPAVREPRTEYNAANEQKPTSSLIIAEATEIEIFTEPEPVLNHSMRAGIEAEIKTTKLPATASLTSREEHRQPPTIRIETIAQQERLALRQTKSTTLPKPAVNGIVARTISDHSPGHFRAASGQGCYLVQTPKANSSIACGRDRAKGVEPGTSVIQWGGYRSQGSRSSGLGDENDDKESDV